MPALDDRHGRLSRRLLVALLATMALLLWTVPALAENVTLTGTPSYATAAPNVTASNATNVAFNSATLHGNVTNTGGGTITARGFEWGYSTGNYTESWNQTGSFGTGTFSHAVTNLTAPATVYWRAFAVNDVGTGNSTELSFETSLLPLPPTNFTITQASPNSIEITWVTGIGANGTVVIASESGYPETRDDGYQVYSGNGTSVTIDGLLFSMGTYYYSAWSYNDYGYSVDHVEASIGNLLGVPQMLFVVALCGFALWKRGWLRAVLAVCIITWGAFAVAYDVRVAAPLLALGIILVALGLYQEIGTER